MADATIRAKMVIDPTEQHKYTLTYHDPAGNGGKGSVEFYSLVGAKDDEEAGEMAREAGFFISETHRAGGNQ